MMDAPTHSDLFDEAGLKSVQRTADDSWRHGSYINEIFHRASDDTYWRVFYELSTDGESHGLREGTADITQARPVEITTTDYVSAA